MNRPGNTWEERSDPSGILTAKPFCLLKMLGKDVKCLIKSDLGTCNSHCGKKNQKQTKPKQGRARKTVLKPWFHRKCKIFCKISLLLLYSWAACLKELAKASSAILLLPDHSPEPAHGLRTYKCLLQVLKLSWTENQFKKNVYFHSCTKGLHWSAVWACINGIMLWKRESTAEEIFVLPQHWQHLK